MEDRISELPEQIFHHHILSLLRQDDAVRTCILSKSWRHLGPTRPKLEFCERDFTGSKDKFISVVENTLQRYVDQKLSVQEFVLELFMTWPDSGLIHSTIPHHQLLVKWIPIVLMNMGVKKFKLTANDFPLPSLVLEAQFLRELYLHGCKLNYQINVKLHVLKRLELHHVRFDQPETFEKIMSSCPLIQHLVLDECFGVRAIKVNKAHPNLKHLDCSTSWFMGNIDSFGNKDAPSLDSIEINDDAPSLETIHIKVEDYQTWYHHNNKNYFFPRLKSLNLCGVHLPTQLLNNLSSDNCPCLEELQLFDCSGFTEFELSNCSIKRLIINFIDRPIKAAIDAPNMLYFEFSSYYYLPSISFATTTSRECKSLVDVWTRLDSKADDSSTWSRKLHELLKALSHSRISLNTSYVPLTDYDGGGCEPVVVELLWLRADYGSFEIPDLLNCVFRTCRPRCIDLFLSATSSRKRYEMADSIWKALVRKGKTRQSHFWEQDLEESSIQVLDKNTKEWRSVQLCALPKNENFRFRLKWKGDFS